MNLKGINNPFDAVNEFRRQELAKNEPLTKRDYFAGIFLSYQLVNSPGHTLDKLARDAYEDADNFIFQEKKLGKPVQPE